MKRYLLFLLPIMAVSCFGPQTHGTATPRYQPPNIVQFQYPLKNGAYGFPRTHERRLKPFVLICIHICGNTRTATMPVGIKPGDGTWADVQYMARDRHWDSPKPQFGNSAHSYIARDGQVLDCIPTKFAAWNNGDVTKPNLKLASMRQIVAMREKGTNANEAYVREIECTGQARTHSLTAEQRETVAYLIAHDSIEWGLDINRETVHMHADVNSVNRPNCPFTGDREKQLADVIARAMEIRELLKPAKR
jgi:hypothetical protein